MWRYLREVEPVAARQHGCLTVGDLKAARVSKGAVEHAVKAGHLESLHRRVYRLIDGSHYPFTRQMAAALAGGANAFVSRFAALVVFGLVEDDDRDVDVTVPGARRRDRPGVRFRGDRPHPLDLGHFEHVPVTSPARALLDTAPDMPAREFAWLVNEALIQELVTHDDLSQVVDRSPRHPGTRIIRTVAATDPVGDRSELNRLTHEALRRGGVPEPERNHQIGPWNVDFFWPDCRVILEADGVRFHRHAQSVKRDRRKQSDLELLGHRVLRTDWDEVTQRPEAMVGRVLLARAAAPHPAAP